MKQMTTRIVWLVACLGVGTVGLCAEPFAKGPYLGQTQPGSTAQVFAPGLICHSEPRWWEANGTFSADGNTFCFQRVSGIFITENTDQGWTTPELIKSIPANTYSPWSACLSPDANSIFFTRALVKPLSKRNLYRCNRTARGWDKPQELGPPLSSSDKDISCSIAANSNIYLCSGRQRWEEGSWIWVVPSVGNTWTRAARIILDYGPLRTCSPGIAPDESFIVFYSIKPGARGGTETNLYLTLRRPDGSWTKPRNMGPRINSGYYEHGPRISPDKKYLFFNRSNGWDPRIDSVHSDICWLELKEYLPESHR